MRTRLNILSGLIFVALSFNIVHAQTSFDSLNIKQPKHFFKTVIGIDGYRKPERYFADTSRGLNKRLKSYGIKQLSINFHVPLATRNWVTKDSIIRNTHLLLTGNYVSLRPQFAGISDHNLVKFGIGMRYIYNTGKKGVWFADVSPFVTKDASFPSKPYYRLASTFLYSHTASPFFNFRLGITKSFLWGNRFYLPFVGVRFGRLDKVNLSIQFPRSINLSIPINEKFIFSAYIRPQGGMYNFSNADSLYFKSNVSTFHFSRYELNSGLRMDFRTGKNLALYVAGGISSQNRITFYSEGANLRRKNLNYDTYFFSKNIAPGIFVNFGFVLSFGKTRSSFNNKNINEATDINNVLDGTNGSAGIPFAPKKRAAQNLESVRDLVDYNDF